MPSNNADELIARMHVRGASLHEIGRRMGRDAEFIEHQLKLDSVQAHIERFRAEGLGPSGATIYHDDDKREVMGRLKTKALNVLEEVMDKAGLGAKQLELGMRAALWVLERDAVVQEDVRAKDGTIEGQPLMQPVYIDKRAMRALERIAEEFSGPDWIDKLEDQLSEMPPGAE